MKRGDIDLRYVNKVVAVNFFNNHRVAMVGTCYMPWGM